MTGGRWEWTMDLPGAQVNCLLQRHSRQVSLSFASPHLDGAVSSTAHNCEVPCGPRDRQCIAQIGATFVASSMGCNELSLQTGWRRQGTEPT